MKESAYNLCAQDTNGNYCLFNTRRGTAHILAPDAYRAYWAAANGASGLADATATLRDLIDKGFLVGNDVDELSEIMSAHEKARRSRDRIELLIAPSMACNLDCFYCFESNRYAGRMSTAVQSDIVRLVRRYFKSGTKRLDVTWYGGEPLLAFSVVELLSKRLLALSGEFGSEYAAQIVTNGTLLTHEMARQLASWNVKRAQITLDGVPQLHNTRRVAKNGKPTFYRILDGIEAAAAHMHVSLRSMYVARLRRVWRNCFRSSPRGGLTGVVSLYAAPLQKVPGHETRWPHAPQAQLRSVMHQSGSGQLDVLDSREAADLELRLNDLLWKYGFAVSNRLPEPRSTTCMADEEHSWLIEANGDVQKCYWTAGLRAEAAGRLAEEGIVPREPYRKWQDWTEFRNTGCLQCIMLPICLGRCPLKHLSNTPDYCLPFKHNWVGVLARVVGVDATLVPVPLPLAGERIKGSTCAVAY